MSKKAVALRYGEELPAPFVLAKGAGTHADRLIELARTYEIPITPAQSLTETLFEIDAGEMIPESVYEAVAHLLVFFSRVGERSNRR